MEDELKLIVPAGHPLTGRERVTLQEVVSYPFVLREKGSGTRQVMESELMHRGFEPDRIESVMELGSTGAVKSAVEAGIGITIISPSSVKHEQALGLLKVVDIDRITSYNVCYTKLLRNKVEKVLEELSLAPPRPGLGQSLQLQYIRLETAAEIAEQDTAPIRDLADQRNNFV